jgi:hypothetical protein
MRPLKFFLASAPDPNAPCKKISIKRWHRDWIGGRDITTRLYNGVSYGRWRRREKRKGLFIGE